MLNYSSNFEAGKLSYLYEHLGSREDGGIIDFWSQSGLV
jgi:hypothetical protein